MSSSIIRYALVTFALCAVGLPTGSEAARILGFFPVPSKSNIIVHCALADALAEAGHDVTVLSNMANPYKRARYNYLHIDVPALDQQFITDIVNNPAPMYKRMPALGSRVMTLGNNTLSHPTMQQFLRTHGAGSFDLLLLGYFLNDFQVGLAAHFKCPLVISFSVQPIFFVNQMVGNPSEPAYVPTLFSGLKQPMNFWQRVQNFIYTMLEQHVLTNVMHLKQLTFYNHHFPADRYPSFNEMLRNISLVFVNHHSISQGPIRPNVPNLIEIGGIQIKDKPDPLPNDIAKVLNNAENGVIYLSFGSVAQGANLTPAKAKILFNVLSKLPQKVIWRWGDLADTPGQSPNILYKSWLPQDDILAHPNLKLFITHGGQGSVVESQYHGVPMVGIPLFGDQPANVANVVQAGFGVQVDYSSMTEQSLRAAIKEVLENAQYSAAVQAFAKLYRDRPHTARELVVYWVNYVLRYRGAPHLQSPAVHMTSWQLMSLDVLAALALICAAIIGVLTLVCRLLCLACRRKKPVVTSKRVSKTKKKQ